MYIFDLTRILRRRCAARMQLDREQPPALACGCRTVDARALGDRSPTCGLKVDKLGNDLRRKLRYTRSQMTIFGLL
jgi:hypothetical protein